MNPMKEIKSFKDGSTDIEESRRKFLKDAGKLAVYTPPAMLLLMHPSLEAIANSGGRPFVHSPGPGIQRCNNGVGNGSDGLSPGLQKNGKSHLNNDDFDAPLGVPRSRGRHGVGGTKR